MQRDVSADKDIMCTDHSLGGAMANKSLSPGEIFSSGDSSVFCFIAAFVKIFQTGAGDYWATRSQLG